MTRGTQQHAEMGDFGMMTQAQPARRGRGRPRDPATDEKITKAAADLMLLRGYDRTTVDDVADRAGVGKATVYRRWPSKEDLAVAAMETLYAAEIPEPDTGSVQTDLAAGYRSVLAFVNTPEGEAFLRTSIAESVRDERIAALYRASTERREQASRETFERAIARGEVRPDIDIDSAVQWLGGLLAARAITNRPMPRVEDADKLVAFTLRGVLNHESGAGHPG
jgi:AcrR family transcriptional regulator